jgi:hypothetical protein
MREEDNLKELRAYNIGYDLGWYRAHEAIANDLQELSDAILNSATFKQIEREGQDTPIFLAKIMGIIIEIKTMRNEKMPVLLLERQKINELGERIAKLPPEAFGNPISFGDVKLLDPQEPPKVSED